MQRTSFKGDYDGDDNDEIQLKATRPLNDPSYSTHYQNDEGITNFGYSGGPAAYETPMHNTTYQVCP